MPESTPAASAALPHYFTGADLEKLAHGEVIGSNFDLFTAAKVIRKDPLNKAAKQIYTYDLLSKQFVLYIELPDSNTAAHVAGALNACLDCPIPLTKHALKDARAEVAHKITEINSLKRAKEQAERERDEAKKSRSRDMSFLMEEDPRGCHDFMVRINGSAAVRMSPDEVAYEVAKMFDSYKGQIYARRVMFPGIPH